MNATRAQLPRHLIRFSLTRSTHLTQTPLARHAHTESTKAQSLVRPVFWAVTGTIGTVSGTAYALSRSTGRIGHRFEARENQLDRDKWLKEGVEVDGKWLK